MNTTTVIWPNRGRTNTVKVNPTFGPYNSLVAAKNAAVAGDTIEVFPGTYVVAQDDQLFKDGVNWFFYPGAVVTKTNANVESGSGNAYGIFDDRASGAVTCEIDGQGEFLYDAGVVSADLAGTGAQRSANVNIKGTVVVTNGSSTVQVRARRLKVRAYTNNIYVSPLYVTNCSRVEAEVLEFLDTGNSTTVDMGFSSFLGVNLIVNSTGTGPYWEAGDTYVRCVNIRSYIYGVYAAQTGTSQTSLWLSAEVIETTAVNAVYILGDESKATSNWRTWLTVKELRGGYIAYNAGKHYLTGQKLGSTGTGVTVQSSTLGLEVWITLQKLSAAAGNFVAVNAGSGALGTVWLSVQQYEDTGTVAAGFALARGTTNVLGGQIKVANGVGVLVSNAAATVILNGGVRIDTTGTNSANNLPVSLTAAGTVILNGVTLLAPALADAMKGDANRTVKNYGCVANKDKNTNITLSPNGGFTVDSLVA